ncbi:RNA polymerase sigma factor, partial [Nocardioides pelophilus]|uniref:RNA polymerase sigma factor n=1 Tax=Nocardioides pelophilus TaxID=2172019 RepID=UPI0015FF2788
MRRVVGARVPRANVDDLVQETLVRLIEAGDRVDPRTAEAYAITTARHLVARLWRDRERLHRSLPRMHDAGEGARPDDALLVAEDRDAMARVLDRLSPDDRALVVGHEADNTTVGVLAARLGATPGSVAARLHRLRAGLRV